MEVEGNIIKEFLEVNTQISVEEYNSKLPKIISKIKYRRMRKKLLNSLEKFRNSDVILNIDNIIELASYIYNSYSPVYSYRNVEKVFVDPHTNSYGLQISWSDMNVSITSYSYDYPRMEISTIIKRPDIDMTGLSIQTNNLYSANDRKYRILKRINDELIDTIYHYIYDIIVSS
jgi:hypothetical protein